MKIAVATEGDFVAGHFGHCPSFTLIDVADGKPVARAEIPNPGHEPGFLPRFLAEKGVNVIIAGGMGGRAQELFAQSGISTVVGAAGAVDEVAEAYLEGRLEVGDSQCDHGPGDAGHERGDTSGGPHCHN